MRLNPPHVIYVSYDGATEPLGVSQIVPYLERLGAAFSVTLLSFEPAGNDPGPVAERLRRSKVAWVRLPYHKNPRVASTALDIVAGARAIDRIAANRGADIIHVRSYVPALMALRSRQNDVSKIVFDIRGFWADERVEGGIWRKGTLYKLAKRFERKFFDRADAVVTLTNASVPWIRQQVGRRGVPIKVIPTCVDLARFAQPSSRSKPGVALWSGSIGTWYRLDLAPVAAEALRLPLRVVTRDVDSAREIVGNEVQLESAHPDEMPKILQRPHVGLCLVQPSFSKLASAPTRLAEHLACGSPVLVTRGVGDMAAIVEHDRVGASFDPEAFASLERAAEDVRILLGDPSLPSRCRATAEARFSASSGANSYAELYDQLLQ